MILEESDVIEYLSELNVNELLVILLKSFKTYEIQYELGNELLNDYHNSDKK